MSRISKDESGLKSKLVEKLHELIPAAVVLRHEDVRTAGIPDMSVTYNNKTTWWEAKHATPAFDSQGIQELTMLRLASQGHARYIIWYETPDRPKLGTLIVRPKDIGKYETDYVENFPGFDMLRLAQYIFWVHKS